LAEKIVKNQQQGIAVKRLAVEDWASPPQSVQPSAGPGIATRWCVNPWDWATSPFLSDKIGKRNDAASLPRDEDRTESNNDQRCP
jgi:hypothetical protein